MSAIPDLEAHCGSWVAVCRASGVPVVETFSRAVAESIDQSRYEVLTAAQWLARFNRRIREANGDDAGPLFGAAA